MTWPTAAIATTNTDAAGDNPGTARGDLLTALQQANSMRDHIGGPESLITIAGGGAINIGGQATNRICIGGVGGAISSFGATYTAGPVFGRAAIDCTVTYHATSLITPNAANLSLYAGDTFIAWPKSTQPGGSPDGWIVFPGRNSGRQALNGASMEANSTLTVGRMDSVNEGGQIAWCRSSDNSGAWACDVFNDGTTHVFRIINLQTGTVMATFGTRPGVALTTVPATAADPGVAGQFTWDASYLYVCTAANTWKRAALATW